MSIGWMRSSPALMVVLLAVPVFAQPQGGGGGGCPMCSMGGGSMWVGMALAGLLIVAAIVTLIALATFLFRRSSRQRPA